MPDTLLTVFISMGYFIFLTFLPYYIWSSNGGITLNDLLYNRHQLPEEPSKVKIAILALEEAFGDKINNFKNSEFVADAIG